MTYFSIQRNESFAKKISVAGYLYNQVLPRLAMGTHVNFDSNSHEKIIAEVRTHWCGSFHLGTPDMTNVNITNYHIWVKDGIVPKFPNIIPFNLF